MPTEMPERIALDEESAALLSEVQMPGDTSYVRADLLAEAMRERDEARAALDHCVRAHETGRFEPAQAACEAARALLGDR